MLNQWQTLARPPKRCEQVETQAVAALVEASRAIHYRVLPVQVAVPVPMANRGHFAVTASHDPFHDTSCSEWCATVDCHA